MDSAGNFVWARQLGGTGNGIAVDASGNVLTTGSFGGTADFDPGAGTNNLTSAGSFDIFISKLDSAGNLSLAFAVGAAAGGTDKGQAIATDAAGNVYTTGYFQGTIDFDPGPGVSLMTSAGGTDIFVVKLDSAGNFVWARQFGGTSDDQGNGIAVDASGNVLTTGYFKGTADFVRHDAWTDNLAVSTDLSRKPHRHPRLHS